MLKIKKNAAEPARRADSLPERGDRSLLIVDDEAGILLLLQSLFAPLYTVRVAESGFSALELLREGFAPQVIIADQRMPGMSGSRFFAESRKILPNAVRVTLTGYTDVKEIIDSVNDGAIYRFVGKPWEDEELVETIRLCFEQYDLSTQKAELEAALARAQRLNSEKNDIMGIVSHDLKNPISVVLGMTELMKSDEFGLAIDDYRQFAGMVHQTALNMMELVKGMLDDYWLESGAMDLALSPTDASVLAAALVEEYRRRAAEKNIALHLDAPSPAFALADERRLYQALDNLLSNAVKYSPFGKEIFVRVLRREHTVCIEIHDQGPGLTDDDKAKLFMKFARLSAQPTGGEHSSGLGLSVVKKMIDAMNGNVRCESEAGKGATFIVELPAAQAR